MRSYLRVFVLSLLSGILVQVPSAITGGASAQSFPTKAVRIVVPFAAGGALDSVVRVIAEQLQARWGHPVIVENRVGASGNVGADYVAHAEANGHTLLASPPPPLAINQFLFRSLTFKPADFAAIAILATAPNILIARPGLPVSTLPELIALAKASPGKLSYASTGRGGTPHLTMEWLKLGAGIDLAHVP
jgi:tripartite-type tricarboxylate transporter receptor subunit TctC